MTSAHVSVDFSFVTRMTRMMISSPFFIDTVMTDESSLYSMNDEAVKHARGCDGGDKGGGDIILTPLPRYSDVALSPSQVFDRSHLFFVRDEEKSSVLAANSK